MHSGTGVEHVKGLKLGLVYILSNAIQHGFHGQTLSTQGAQKRFAHERLNN